MESSHAHPMKGDEVEVDYMVVGREKENVGGRQNEKKKLVVVGIEKQGKGVSRMYGQKITKSMGEELSKFFDNHIDKGAKIRTDRWSGYKPLKKAYPQLSREYSGKKVGNF